jgi:Ca2+-transporting ATPase
MLGHDYVSDRREAKVIELFPFSSESKKMATLVKGDAAGIPGVHGKFMLYSKGASEIILRDCSRFIDADGSVRSLDQENRDKFTLHIKEFAQGSLRTLCIACKPLDSFDTTKMNEATSSIIPHILKESNHDMILLALFGIQDPVRPEVPLAVATCQKAGICVRMVTGDNSETARAIAIECGILTGDGVVIEGPEFRKLSLAQMDAIVPKLQVMARSSPMDKQTLVQCLKRLGETVAVTGDGTNDAPALKCADVGFSMGIAGTEVAKEASDIVLLDDCFASLVKAVVWGRSVYDSVRKFLQFQLTVNVVCPFTF